MKNKLSDLNNHLFEQLERLNDEDLTDEELEKEIKRSRAISTIADKIINNAGVVLDAVKHADEYGRGKRAMPEVLGIEVAKDEN
jgi:benzoyl-CoA reductase/2-hydroxyglutaryl-CoA dehydratase subunit BcrC/BadD/HgdB